MTVQVLFSMFFAKKTRILMPLSILSMIPKGEGWHYIAVKKLSALLRGISSKHDGYFYCLNSLRLFRTKNT